MKTLALLFLSTTLAFACKQTTTNQPDHGSGAPPTAAPPTTTRPPAANADRVEVLARHNKRASSEDLDTDPVVVHFDKFAVAKAHFDPTNLEGGTATIELDLASIKTGSIERDEDLKSPEYFDLARFATATIEVANVKKQADTKYTAAATVAFHGVTKTYQVTFEVLATTADTVRIKGEHAFSRLDFSLSSDPDKDPEQRIDAMLTIQLVITLKTS